jgi:hemolysin activation/secretion protein
VTGGLVNDISHGRFDTWVIAADWRRYLRTSLRSAVALRGLGYYAGGDRPRPVNIGGSWAVRGYPLYGYIAGTRAWLVNTEWRFPIVEFLSLGFPFGVARFPGIQGALFADAGRAWSAVSTDRGTVGSFGLGLRMPVGPPLVLRLDLGYRFHRGGLGGYALPSDSRGTRFVDFFFGFNY